jgi:iron complex outermembrane receptor protein
VGANARVEAIKLDGRLAAFHYDYSDLQVQDVADNTVVIRNAATAKSDGVEAELRYQPARGLMLEAAGTYLHARFSRYRTVNLKTPELGVLDLAGNPLPQSPKLKGRVSGEYALQVSEQSRVTLRMDAMWQDRIYFSAFKDPRAMQRQYAWFKGRLAFQSSPGRYEIGAFVDNITNVRVFTNISITGDLDGSRSTGNMAPPRTFGVQFTRTF